LHAGTGTALIGAGLSPYLHVRWSQACSFLVAFFAPTVASAQDLDPKEVRISLQQALPIAIAKAEAEFPDLDDYNLHSVHPRALKGDPKGLHWEFVWKAKAFPHRKAVIVRIYMKDGAAMAEREQVADQR
jgi:hypothetical protein